jgi:uncharacterized protein
MDINVSQLLRESIGATRQHHIDTVSDVIGDGKKHKITGDCTLLRTHQSILATCALNTELELTCSRCLKQFHLPLKIKFEEEFLPTVDVNSGIPLPPADDANAFTIDEHHILDLSEAIRQYILVNTPMKALCKKECAGICPTCGKNLNEGNCNCPRQDIDPRWSKLAELK